MTLKERAKAHANERYWDIASVGAEQIDMDRKCGAEDFEAGALLERRLVVKRIREYLEEVTCLFLTAHDYDQFDNLLDAILKETE